MIYHNITKHSYESIRSNPNRLDWDHQPKVFKTYDNVLKTVQFDQKNETHRFLYLIAGITAKKSYPGVEYYLRTNPSAGALYPNEIYFQTRNVDGFTNGIYHYNIAQSCFDMLYEFEGNEGIEADLELESQYDGFIFLISSVYYRSSWKYKNRAFRYCLLDAGHILGSLEASSYIYEKAISIKYDFNKEKLNRQFGFEDKEFFNSAVICGKQTSQSVRSVQMQLDYVDPCYYFEQNKLIEDAYKDSIMCSSELLEPKKIEFDLEKHRLEEVIFKRRSIRDLTSKSIQKNDFEQIMQIVNRSVQADSNEEIKVYAVINRVQDIINGVYYNGQYIKTGDFSQKAGYLCLEQSLGSQSAVTFFLISQAQNYQALYQKAGIIGHRIYLSSNYLNIGCSGIGAYYDDEVLQFLQLDQDHMVLYALAIGN